MRKLFLPILLAGLLTAPALAQVDEPKLAETAPDRYVVVPGDTLWGIAGRFLKDPYRWPDVWEPNKADIKNPNRIYPGNVLVLDRSGKTPRLRLATIKVDPRVRSDMSAMEIPSIPSRVIEPFLAAPLVVEEGGLANAPKIVATQQGRTFLGSNDIAYVAGNVKFAYYLRVVHVEGAGEISIYLAALIGALMGFLWFNAYPAQVFMATRARCSWAE